MRAKQCLIIATVIVALVAAYVVLRKGSQGEPAPEPKPPLELLRSELQLLDQRLVMIGSTNPFTGVLIEQYPSENPKSRTQVIDGKLNGLSEGWYTNEVLAVQETFTNGVSHGLRTKWYGNGNKKSEAPIAEGKIHGTYRRWSEDGSLSEEIEMNNGQAEGLSRSYFPSGFVKAQVTMRKGEVVEREGWNDSDFRAEPLGGR
jgi:antitoxin component YwqK of YwqJK toxin-antitoxin module